MKLHYLFAAAGAGSLAVVAAFAFAGSRAVAGIVGQLGSGVPAQGVKAEHFVSVGETLSKGELSVRSVSYFVRVAQDAGEAPPMRFHGIVTREVSDSASIKTTELFVHDGQAKRFICSAEIKPRSTGGAVNSNEDIEVTVSWRDR